MLQSIRRCEFVQYRSLPSVCVLWEEHANIRRRHALKIKKRREPLIFFSFLFFLSKQTTNLTTNSSKEKKNSELLRTRFDMETSLKIDSKTRRSCIFVKQRFTNSENYCLTLSGNIDLQNAKCKANAYVRKKFFPTDLNPIVSRIDCGVNYDTETDDVIYKLRGKKSFDITSDGLTTLDVKGGVDLSITSSTPKMDAKIELSKTLFNFQPDQDLNMKIGFNAQTKRFYGQIRENNWSINTDFSRNRWNFQYDL